MYANYQQAVIDHLEENDINYQQFSDEGDEGIVAFHLNGHNGSYSIFVETYQDADVICVEAHSAIRVPEGARKMIGELSQDINDLLLRGRFGLDRESGRWGFHIGHKIGDEFSNDLIRDLICTSVVSIDRYFPATNAVIYGNESVEFAIKLANMNWEQKSV